MANEVCAYQQLFLAVMRAGWACADPTVTHMKGMPGFKEIRFEFDAHSFVVDQYASRPHSAKSFGTTTLFQNDQPVWVMQYGGWYPEYVIPFLKACLCKAYLEQKKFIGGRGPTVVTGDRFVYRNNVLREDFTDGHGFEEILDLTSNKVIGSHWYRYMVL